MRARVSYARHWRTKREDRKISVPRIILAKDTPPNDMADDNSRGHGPKSSLKNKRDRYVCAFSNAFGALVRAARHDSRERVVVIVPNITIAAKLQRPVLLARERPRAPQNHNTTPYKIQYDAAAGRHLPLTATTSSSRHPRSWLIATRVRRARVIFQGSETPPFKTSKPFGHLEIYPKI